MGRHSEGIRLKKFPWSDCWYIIGLPKELGRRKSTGQTDRELAEHVLTTIINEADKKQRRQDEFTIGEIIDMYLIEHASKLPSAETAKYYAVPLRSYFGQKSPDQLTPNFVRSYTESKRTEGFKDGTIKRQLVVLSAALNYARKEGKLSHAPFIPMPAGSPPKERWLTRKEAQKLLAMSEGHIKLFIAVALFTGARKGAILDLTWKQIDLKQRLIDFNVPGADLTNKRRSAVPINDELYKLLKAVKVKRGHLIQYHGERVLDIKKGFKAACQVAGLKNVTPHTLRHTAGTWLAQAGVDMWRIGGILGHSNLRTTQRYLKHNPAYLQDAMQNLSVAHNLIEKKIKHLQKPQKSVRQGK